jgi:formyltetrahydrofolate deformylase
VKVRLAGRPLERKRVAVLVTKEGHCLEQLVRDRDAGKLAGDMVVVLSNHPTLEPLAAAAGIPFEWSASTDKERHFEWLLERLAAVKPDLLVLARYMQILRRR